MFNKDPNIKASLAPEPSDTTTSNVATPRDLLESLNDAIQLLPGSEKDAYVEALRIAPTLVQAESNPMLFIRHENFNVWAAAKRLAAYWTMRKELFGDTGFLKPIHLTGDAALTPPDVAVLETGAVCLLPKISSSGQRVLWWDREKLSNTQLRESVSRMRAIFYIIQIVMADEDDGDDDATTTAKSSKKSSDGLRGSKKSETSPGLVVLANFPSNYGLQSDFDFTQRIARMIRTGFPVTISAIHFVWMSQSRTQMIITGVANMTIQLLGQFFPFVSLIHTGTTMKEIQGKLREAGFEKRNLPTKIGGNWKDEKFEQFKRRRRKFEEEMFLSDDEKLQRKRQVNMIHSRQKRERRKIEYEVLQEQSDQLLQQMRN